MKHSDNSLNIREKIFKEFYCEILDTSFGITKNRHDAEDITSQCFARLYEMPGIESMKMEEIKGFLLTAVKNASIDHFRRKRSSRNYLHSRLAHEDDAYELDYEFEKRFAKSAEAVKKLIEEEPEKRRKILKARYLEGKKAPEISASLGITLKTVNNTLTRGKESLRKKMKKLGIWK